MPQAPKLLFIGAGNIAEALVSGILKAHLAPPANIAATDVSKRRVEHFQQHFQIRAGFDNAGETLQADVVILCVKPQIMDSVLMEIKGKLQKHQMVISVAAGYPLSRIQHYVGDQIPLVRAMPNTPAVIREGVTALAGGPGLLTHQLQLAQAIFDSVGKTVLVEEPLLDAVTGLSGSGPAYVYLIIEALTDGGVRVGLPRGVAGILAAQTVAGAARMVLETGEHPALLKDRVTSPGGTTIAGLQQLEAGRLRATLMQAVETATIRSRELGQ